MQIYAAPLEGVTGYIFRRAHHHYFTGIDKYFTPFLSPKAGKGWNNKEKNDILPEHNEGIPVVPQILTNRAEEFLRVSERLYDLGYAEVNLNLGCPSGTVTAKGKGSGFLREPDALRRFFEEVFAKIRIRVSVKSRLGVEEPEEIDTLMDIYNEFPLSEVILHARVLKDYYKNPVHREVFRIASLKSVHPVCYNGDIFSAEDAVHFREECPETERIMLGRGLVGNPQLAEAIRARELSAGKGTETFARDLARWRAFHDEICAGYEEILSGERNVLFKMKELWSYLLPSFETGQRYAKKIRKVQRLSEYRELVSRMFEEEGWHDGKI